MAMTVNDMTARTDGTVDWSDEDWKNFIAMTKQVGNAIIGKNTYDVAVKEGSLLTDCLTVVLTHSTDYKNSKYTIFTDKSPRQVLDFLK